ncbi:uncharacterized protein LOC100177792 [Ciona intestinalis]
MCLCRLSCNDFEQRLACSDLTPQIDPTVCKALNRACTLQRPVRIKTINITQYINAGRNCRNILTPWNEDQLCLDQSFCHNNGICYVSAVNSQPYCRCKSTHCGRRCQCKKPQVSATRDSTNRVLVSISRGGESTNQSRQAGGVGAISHIVPYVTIGIFSCMLACCFVVGYRKRRQLQEHCGATDANVTSGSNELQEVTSPLQNKSEETPTNSQCDVIKVIVHKQSKTKETDRTSV